MGKQKKVGVDATQIPRVMALHGNDQKAVAEYLGVQMQMLNTLTAIMGLDISEVPDDRLQTALALLAETMAENTFASLRAARTEFVKATAEPLVEATFDEEKTDEPA